MQYSFLDETYQKLYRSEQRIGQLFTVFSLLAILIASLGLFGLASFMAERRTKEIGIRKVLGATISNIITMMSWEFVMMVIISGIIAIPIAYYFMNQWLSNFAYHISISVGIFILATTLALGIALLTVSFQAVKAALANPVDSLRYE
jgi:putative ABC transport system permease protein